MTVRPELVADPNLLAASSNGLPGDAKNLDKSSSPFVISPSSVDARLLRNSLTKPRRLVLM